MRAALLGAVIALVLVPASSAAVHWWGFESPSGNIVCNSNYVAPHGVDCVVFSASPSLCQKTWSLPARGPASVHCVQANIGTDVHRLPYGARWVHPGVECASARTGVTCRNASQHGFFLSRERQRVF